MSDDAALQVPFDKGGRNQDDGYMSRGFGTWKCILVKFVLILVLFPLVVWCFRIPLTVNLRSELLPDSWDGGEAWLEERPHCWAWKTCMTVTYFSPDKSADNGVGTQTFILPTCATDFPTFATNDEDALIVTYPDCGRGRATIRIYPEDFTSHGKDEVD